MTSELKTTLLALLRTDDEVRKAVCQIHRETPKDSLIDIEFTGWSTQTGDLAERLEQAFQPLHTQQHATIPSPCKSKTPAQGRG